MKKEVADYKVLGSDRSIVNIARVSTNKNNKEYNFNQNIKLLKHLYKERHASVFEHAVILIHDEKLINILKPYTPYHHSSFIAINLRQYIQHKNSLTLGFIIDELVEKHFPAIYDIIHNREPIAISDKPKYEYIEIKTSSGIIALVDRVEYNTPIDFYTFYVECPIFVARQWMRHRNAVYTELSRRYSAEDIQFYTPNVDFSEFMNYALEYYNKLLEKGYKKEEARLVLPMATMTKFYFTAPRYSIDHFISLRKHPTAQKEIQEFANAIEEIIGYKEWDKKFVKF